MVYEEKTQLNEKSIISREPEKPVEGLISITSEIRAITRESISMMDSLISTLVGNDKNNKETTEPEITCFTDDVMRLRRDVATLHEKIYWMKEYIG